jgi:hypothetical protein
MPIPPGYMTIFELTVLSTGIELCVRQRGASPADPGARARDAATARLTVARGREAAGFCQQAA